MSSSSPPLEAGSSSPRGGTSPSRFPPPRSQHQSPASPSSVNKSPTRSLSLSSKAKGKAPAFSGHISPYGIKGQQDSIVDEHFGSLILGPKHHFPSTSTPSPPTRRRTVSQDSSSPGGPTPPPKDDHLDSEPSIMQTARIKVSSRDQQAMRKLRSTMDFSDSSSSKSGSPLSPLSPLFPIGVGPTAGREAGTRRSTLSKQTLTAEDLSSELLQQTTPKPVPTTVPVGDLVVPVIGHAGVGKTTLIEKALKVWGIDDCALEEHGGRDLYTYRTFVEPGGKIRQPWRVQLVEMDMEVLDGPGDILGPNVSGAILCYDSTRKESLVGLTEALKRLSADATPMVIFACKSDPGAILDVEAVHGNAIGEPFNVGLIEVSASSTEGKSKMRNGFRWLLYKMEQRHRRQQRILSPKRDSLVDDVATPRPPSSSLDGLLTSPDSDSSGTDGILWKQGLSMIPGHDRDSDTRSSSSSLGWMMKPPLSLETSTPPTVVNLSVKTGDSISSILEKSDVGSIKSLEDLLNRLFAAIVSLEDELYITTFYMTFRRFCHPHELMQEFLDRFREIETYAVSKDVRLWAAMKMAGALIKWASRYPGDLKEEETHKVFLNIVNLSLKHTYMGHLTSELLRVDQTVANVTDIDASWSIKPLSARGISPTELVLDSEVLYGLDSAMTDSTPNTPTKERSASLSSTNVAQIDSTSRKASGSEPRLSPPDSRFIGNGQIQGKWSAALQILFDTDPQTFAMELTRIQWGLFRAIRPRDIFRHDFGKERDASVGAAIKHFNHLSYFVSTLILANPKPKHRARAYERFVHIARQLRRLNNYDSLCAVLSGIKETSVTRLKETAQLVNLEPGIEKDFQSHLKLMEPRGGYVHYRRALQADISHGRSAIPLLTTVLGLVSRLQGVRPEDIRPDGMVQWEKFVKFGEMLSIIPECQAKGPMVPGIASEVFRRVLLDTPVLGSEDALFERSKLLESGGPVQGGMLKRLVNMVQDAQVASR